MEKFPLVVQGDIESALVKILQTAPELTGYAGGAPTISPTLDGYQIGQRWITVSSEGGSFSWPKLYNARVDFNVFAEKRKVAYALAQLALGILFREMGQPSATYGVRTANIKVETGLVRADDALNDQPRYLFALRISYVPYSP